MAFAPGLSVVRPRRPPMALHLGELGLAAMIMWGGVAISAAPLSASVQIVALLVGVALIGAPHGIFDIDLALWAAPCRRRRRWVGGFLLVYLALMAVVAVGWLVIPKLTLIGFLAVAAFHFGCEGGDGASHGPWDIAPTFVRGVAVILGPILFHAEATAPIFAGLAGVSVTQALAGGAVAASVLAPVWIAALVVVIGLFACRRAWREAAELSGLIALFVIAPPLFAFTVYFCGVHAVRHTRAMVRAAALREVAAVSRSRLAWAARRLLPAAAVCSLAVLVVLVYGRGSFAEVGGQAVLWTFRVLAALTIPHLILTPMLEARCRVRSASAASGSWCASARAG